MRDAGHSGRNGGRDQLVGIAGAVHALLRKDRDWDHVRDGVLVREGLQDRGRAEVPVFPFERYERLLRGLLMQPTSYTRALQHLLLALGATAVTAFACSNDNASLSNEAPPIGDGGDGSV